MFGSWQGQAGLLNRIALPLLALFERCASDALIPQVEGLPGGSPESAEPWNDRNLTRVVDHSVF
jgi:hypothetical protein